MSNGRAKRVTRKQYSVTYEGKSPEEVVLANTPASNLVATKVFRPFTAPWMNRLIFGDNLPVLKRLLEDPSISGKVRLVYIDPPFATDQAFLGKKHQPAYRDRLSGAEYLEFLRQRLILLREILAEDGSIYLHLDLNMAFEMKVIMDEIFGPSNFRSWISRRKCNRKNYTRKTYGNIQDFILFYTKSRKYVWNRPYEKRGIYDFNQRFPRIEEGTGRRYALVPIHAPGVRKGATGKPWRGMYPPEGKHWMYTPKRLDEFDARGEIYWSPTGNPRRKIYADQSPGVPVQDIWFDFKDAHNQNIDITGYPTEKNPDMLRRIVKASSNEGDLVMDCFAGSGTTPAVADELNRRWVGVDNSKLAIYITLRRLLTADGKGYRSSEMIQSPLIGLAPLDQEDIPPSERITTDPFTLYQSTNARGHRPSEGNIAPTIDSRVRFDEKHGQFILRISRFESRDNAAKDRTQKDFVLPDLVMIDRNCNEKVFSIDEVFVDEELRKTRGEIRLPANSVGQQLAVAYFDVFGNELVEVVQTKPQVRQLTRYPLSSNPQI